MKLAPTLTFHNALAGFSRPISRERAAYLLRAARSRRFRNVSKDGRYYSLLDCNHSIRTK